MRKAATTLISDPVTDNGILEGMITGDRDALEQLYANCFPTVSRMVLLNNGTEDEAKDVFQEAVLVLYDKVVHQKDFKLNCLLGTYLYAVSRRIWLKDLREKGRYGSEGALENEEQLQLNADLAIDLTVHLEKEAQFDKMETCLEQLGDPCRRILLDFYMKGKSMQEICDQLGYTNADNVKNQKYKCLKRLKKMYFKG